MTCSFSVRGSDGTVISGTVDAAFAVSEAFEDDRERPKAPENESKKKSQI